MKGPKVRQFVNGVVAVDKWPDLRPWCYGGVSYPALRRPSDDELLRTGLCKRLGLRPECDMVIARAIRIVAFC